MTIHRVLIRAGLALALLLSMAASGAAEIEDLRRLVESGQYEQAYAAARQTPDQIGNVHFDFLYGVAAVNSGHVAEGILALERHLAAVPGNDRARLELARGYFLVGEYARARAEFEFVLRYNPPPAVRQNIMAALAAMDLRDAPQLRASSRLYGEIGIGHDSNVNGGTYRDELQLVSGNQPIAPASKARPDSFIEVATGGARERRISNRLSVFAGVDLDVKHNDRARDFDLANLGANIGFTNIVGSGLYRGSIAASALQVGAEPYRNTISFVGEANYRPRPQTALQLFGQYSQIRYVGANQILDSHSVLLGAMLTQDFPSLPWQPQAGVRLSFTQEDNLQLRSDLSLKMPLVRLFAAGSPNPRWRIAAGLTGYSQHYGGDDLVLGTERHDVAWTLDASATYALAPHWTLRAEVSDFVNRSNQTLYDSRRQLFALKTRYDY